jgi:hypothetical protein
MTMATTAAGFRLRRTVPHQLTVEGAGFTLGVAGMRSDPDRVVVQVATAGARPRREELVPGEVLTVGSERWRLVSLVVGARGTADFVRASE